MIKLWDKEQRTIHSILRVGQEGDVLVIGEKIRRVFVFENGQWVEIERGNNGNQESAETVGCA